MLFHTVNNQKQQEAEKPADFSFGGFSAKWEYEAYRRRKEAGRRRGMVMLACSLSFVVAAVVAVFCVRYFTQNNDAADPEESDFQTASMLLSNDEETEEEELLGVANVEASADAFRTDHNVFNGEDHPFDLGFHVVELDAETSRKYRIPTGVLISRVEKDSPAEKMGLLEGDVIVGMNEVRIFTVENLNKLYPIHRKEYEIRFDVYRGDEQVRCAYVPVVINHMSQN